MFYVACFISIYLSFLNQKWLPLCVYFLPLKADLDAIFLLKIRCQCLVYFYLFVRDNQLDSLLKASSLPIVAE
jgi:hypothetical protein